MLVTLLAAALAALAAEAPAPQAAEPIVAAVRKEVSLSVATGQEKREYGLTRVQRDGQEVVPPANMKLDPKTGVFTWTPTPSQAGDYEIAFLIRNPNAENERTTRRIRVEPPPIVPPGDNSEIAKLLRQWHKEGTAAGNTGDFYDNRDRGHSMLNTAPYPQLDRIEYTKEQLDRRMDWALQLHFLHPHVVFGNSSTASGDPNWGSNPRHALYIPGAAQVLHAQYTRNHLYIYPEHIDHDPGHNGRGRGYGDLFPANTPYFIVSQGSSGSDQPFMRAVPYTLAAFRPEVKRLLIERGLLMPTVQMILRMCYKQVAKPEDYLTGKAHPTVFEGPEVNALKMVQMAHEMQRDNVPPMAQLAAFEEDLALNGQDYFEAPGVSERLFDTPCVIARIHRSTRHTRRMIVSAKASFDANKRPLTFHWVVLRGDAARIRITPVEKDGSVVELLIPWHERFTLPNSGIATNRVDIGLFVHNGAYYSAPAFVCVYSLDDEARTYAPDGRIVEMFYGYGDSTIGYPHAPQKVRDPNYDVTDWAALLALLDPARKDFAAERFRERLSPQAIAALLPLAAELEAAAGKLKEPQQKLDDAQAAANKAAAALNDAKKKLDEARKAAGDKPSDEARKALDLAEAKLKELDDARKKADATLNEARKHLDAAQGGLARVLTSDLPGVRGWAKDHLEAPLNAIRTEHDFYLRHAKAIDDLANACQDAARKKAFLDAREALIRDGIMKAEEGAMRKAGMQEKAVEPTGGATLALSPVIPGPEPPLQRLTKYERSRLEWFNICILQNVLYPGALNRRQHRNFVSVFLTTKKSWRDVYHYDDKGRLTGWTRHEGAERKDFTPDGALVTRKDALGRAIEARTVDYLAEGGERQGRTLKSKPGDTIRHYAYDGDQDRLGRVAHTEKAPQ